MGFCEKQLWFHATWKNSFYLNNVYMSDVYHDAGDNDDIILSGFHGTNIGECRYLNYLYTAFIISVNWKVGSHIVQWKYRLRCSYVYRKVWPCPELQIHTGLENVVEHIIFETLHCKENPIYVFPEKKLGGLIHNFHIDVSVSDLYISTISQPIFLQQNKQTDRGNI